MEKELQITADGSHTLYIPAMDEHYHSVNGALQESRHIFIEAGLHALEKDFIRIVEIGFGTGLNAFLTLKDVELSQAHHIDYHTVELYPLPLDTIRALNYGELIWPERKELFLALHEAEWNFDAFAPEKQPEMWNQEIYNRLYAHTAPGGVIVTYCAKGEVRRGMQAAGFEMSRLPGPPGKRHILRGIKN